MSDPAKLIEPRTLKGFRDYLPELMIPRDIRVLDALPVLGTGKLDYVALGEMARG